VTLRNPDIETPMETIRKAPKNCQAFWIWLISRNPMAQITVPIRIMRRMPNRSNDHPFTGPNRPLSARVMENAPANKVLLQPNSSLRSTA